MAAAASTSLSDRESTATVDEGTWLSLPTDAFVEILLRLPPSNRRWVRLVCRQSKPAVLARRHRRADAAATEQARGAGVLHQPRGRFGVRHRRPRGRTVQAGVGSPRRPQHHRQEEGHRRDRGRHVQRAAVPVRQHQARRRHLAAQPCNPRDATPPAAARRAGTAAGRGTASGSTP
jgi:CRP-like cAMP-binding protein